MNEVNARAVRIHGGHQGQFRKVHKADWETVCINGIPQVYDTADQAEVAAWRALKAHLQGDIVGSGEKSSAILTDAEAKFQKLFRGGGKTVTVERR